MKLGIYEDYDALSTQAANEVIALITKNPNAVFCLASGDTPRLTCQLIVQKAKAEKVDFSKCTFVGLDEWLGISPQNEGSCRYFFQKLLIDPLELSTRQTFLFDALNANPEAQCKEMDKKIFEKGGIDLMIVGIGMNGHIGFNEPGISFDNYSHVADLDETTITVGQKYFAGPMELKRGITLGLRHLKESRKVILMANGKKKANVIREAVEGEITNQFPASIIQQHPNGAVMIDKEAAAMLNPKISESRHQQS